MIARSRGVSSAEKAAYHHEAGAGKSRVKRPFFDLSPKDEAAILTRVDQAVAAALR